MATQLVRENDVIQLHLPQFDAAGVALRGRLWRKPTIITYHCDLQMPPGLLNRAANLGIKFMNELAARFAHRIVTNTRDYAENSTFLKRYLHKLKVIAPPVTLPTVTPVQKQGFATTHNPEGRYPVIGMASRFATEKGVEVLLDALPEILRVFPQAMVQFVGAYKNVIGEEKYFKRLAPRIQQYEKSGNWSFLGFIPDEEMASFYANLDVLVLPSLNSTESFGIVQVEAMIEGVPVAASDLPGVRQPVTMHGMGKVFPAGDSVALGESVLELLQNRSAYVRDPQSIQARYLPQSIAEAYEREFKEIQREMGMAPKTAID